MVKKGKVVRFREKLERTLTSDNLTDREKLTELVRNQILRSSEYANEGYIDNVLAKRTDELSNMLDMLRSASDNYEALPNAVPHPSWKLKQDNDEFRVMYREGPEGSPFHTLLVEGYVDAPVDASLCISWETELYPTWFPEIRIPTFKVICAKRLHKIRIGEQISLVRMKLSWPLSNREVLLHYFEFEYFEGDLVIVMLNTIDDVESVKLETHGFTNEEIPEAGQMVRVDLVGGFALQKVTEDATYFRTIANLDVKLDFVPPSLINFISRQLIGSAFRLYKKSVLSISRDDPSFWEPLDNTLYKRITEALYSRPNQDESTESESVLGSTHKEPEEDKEKGYQHDLEKDEKIFYYSSAYDSGSPQNEPAINQKVSSEIEEENEDKIVVEEGGLRNQELVEHRKSTNNELNGHESEEYLRADKKVLLSPPVEKAIGTLDKVIHMLRERRQSQSAQTDFADEVSEKLEAVEAKHLAVEDHGKNWIDSYARGFQQSSSEEEIVGKTSPESHNIRTNGSNLHSNSVGLQKMARESLDRNVPSAGASPQVASPFVANGLMATPSPGMSTTSYNTPTPNDGIHENHLIQRDESAEEPKKWRFCCLRVASGRLVSS